MPIPDGFSKQQVDKALAENMSMNKTTTYLFLWSLFGDDSPLWLHEWISERDRRRRVPFDGR